MISETIGAWMMVAGVALGTVAWIGLRVSLRYERAARLWKAWRAAARGNPWRNGVRIAKGRCATCWHMTSHPDDPACKACVDGDFHWAWREAQ